MYVLPLNHGFSIISTFCCSKISNPFLNPLVFDLSKYELTVLVNTLECRLVLEEVLARSSLGGNLTRTLFVVLLDVLLGWLRLSWTQVSSRKRTANGTRHTRAPEYDNEHEHIYKGRRQKKSCCSFGFCPNYLPSPQFGQLVQLFFERQKCQIEYLLCRSCIQPKKQIKVQIIGILEEKDSFY